MTGCRGCARFKVSEETVELTPERPILPKTTAA